MTERPAILSAAEVRAVLGGGPVELRRVVKPQPWYGSQVPGGPHFIWPPGSGQRYDAARSENGWYAFGPREQREMSTHCPLGAAGTRLWAREGLLRGVAMGGELGYRSIQYAATLTAVPWVQGETVGWCGRAAWPWKLSRLSPASMPKWASRLTVTVTAVRVERDDAGTWAWVVTVENAAASNAEGGRGRG